MSITQILEEKAIFQGALNEDFCMSKGPNLHGGNRRQVMRHYHLSQLVDFSANINPLGPPPQLSASLHNNLALIEEYPPEYPRQLEKNLAARHGLAPENLIAANGSTELIYLLPYLQLSGQAVIVTPAFSEYERACLAARRELLFWSVRAEEGFACDWKSLFKHHGRRMGMLFLANPNNPSGGLLPKSELLYLLEKAEEYDFLLIVDEAFLEFVEDAEQHTLLNEAARSEHLLLLRSLTKFYAIPGLRLGYGVGNPAMIARLRALQPPWSVNSLAQAVGEVLLGLKEYQQETRRLVKAQRELLYQALLKHPFFEPYPSAANYLLVKITKLGLSAASLQEKLIRRSYLIRNCANFRELDESYFRLAVRTPSENQGLLAALEELTDDNR